jgi:hypothetical protein
MAQIEALEAAVATLVQAGAVELSDAVAFRVSDEAGVGIFATTAVEKGTVLIKVPFASTISVERVVGCEALAQIFADNEGLLSYPDEVLAIGLMYACAHPCPWALHVSTMPRTFNTPLYWSNEELEQLRGTNVFHLALMMKRQMEADYASIYIPLKEAYPELLGEVDMSLYVWALSAVYSRALDVTRGQEHVRVLVPLLDMANHSYYPSNGSNTVLTANDTFAFEDDFVCVKAGAALDAGAEVHAVYGNYCNSKLLHTYGFVVPHNPFQAVDAWTKLMPSSALYEQKVSMLV